MADTPTKNKAEGPPESPKQNPPERRQVDWQGLLPAIAFVLIVGVAGVLYWRHAEGIRAEQRALALQVESAGLPRGYPLLEVPLPEEFTIHETRRDTSESTDGRPMDMWFVEGVAIQSIQEVFDFYRDTLLAAGLGQTQLISVPNSFYVEYGDERGTVTLEIDSLRDESGDTRLRITIHRLK